MTDLFSLPETEHKTTWQFPILRPYQIEASDAFLNGDGSGLIQLPTGMGKTLVVARTSRVMIDRGQTGKHLFLAHTKELVRQTCLAYMRFGIWPSVERGESKGQPFVPTKEEKEELFRDNFPPNRWFIFDRVIIGTYQTLVRRVDKYSEDNFDLFVIDEAHRSECRSYHTIAHELRVNNPDLRLLGLTATPKRGDSKPLSLFPQFFYRMPLTQAIDDGWAVDVRAKKCVLAGDFSQLRTIVNDEGEEDFSDAELATIIRHPEVIESIALPIIEFGENRRGIVFTCGQDISEILSDAINSILYKDINGVEFYGILNKDTNKVKHKPFDDINSLEYVNNTLDDSWEIRPCATFVHGSVPDSIRDQRIKDFRNGKYRLIVGCQMLVEGFDVPDIALVVMARLTGSSSFYEQCLGRGLRLLKDIIKFAKNRRDRLQCILESPKPDCKILDFCNNTTRHKIVNAETVLLGGELPDYVEYSEAIQDSEVPLRKQLDEIKSLAELREALKDFSISSNDIDFITEDVNIFGQGRQRDAGQQLRNSTAPGKTLIEKAQDFYISNPERYTSEALEAKIEQRKSSHLGKTGYRTLMSVGVKKEVMQEVIDRLKPNWIKANNLRKVYFGNKKKLPDNWQDILTTKPQAQRE